MNQIRPNALLPDDANSEMQRLLDLVKAQSKEITELKLALNRVKRRNDRLVAMNEALRDE